MYNGIEELHKNQEETQETGIMVFEGHNVEAFEFKNQVLFNPYHCGACLDLGDSAVRMAIGKMNQNQVRKLTNSDVKDLGIRKLNNAGENFLTESGVYKLTFKSQKPEAEKFQDWVTDEVLPTLRKNGTYAVSISTPTKPQSINSIIAKDARATMSVAKLFGLKGNQAILSTNNVIKKAYGIDCLALLGTPALIKDDKIQYFTPSILGKKVNLNPAKFNQLLAKAGLQREERDHKNRLVWNITESGKPYCEMVDTGRKHGNGTPVLQVKWSEDVLQVIETAKVEGLL